MGFSQPQFNALPIASDVVTVSIPDLFGAAASDPLVTAAINALVAAALSQAAKQNLTIGTATPIATPTPTPSPTPTPTPTS